MVVCLDRFSEGTTSFSDPASSLEILTPQRLDDEQGLVDFRVVVFFELQTVRLERGIHVGKRHRQLVVFETVSNRLMVQDGLSQHDLLGDPLHGLEVDLVEVDLRSERSVGGLRTTHGTTLQKNDLFRHCKAIGPLRDHSTFRRRQLPFHESPVRLQLFEFQTIELGFFL